MSTDPRMTPSYFTEVMNGIVRDIALPILTAKGFRPSPFIENWYGKDNLKSYNYNLLRINDGNELEYLNVYVSRANLRIELFINVFLLIPNLDSLDALDGYSIFPFILPPNALTQMQVGVDEYGKIPLVRLFREKKLVMGTPKNETVLNKRRTKISSTIKMLCDNIDGSFERWHERHQVRLLDWKGVPMDISSQRTSTGG